MENPSRPPKSTPAGEGGGEGIPTSDPRFVPNWPLADLIPDERNARVHSPDQVARLVASIRKFGFVNPVIVRPDGRLLAGHGRTYAAIQAGLRTVPAIVVPHLSDDEARAYILADNRLAELAEWNEDLLLSELEAVRDIAPDLVEAAGFTEDEIAALAAEEEELPDEEKGEGESDGPRSCPKCGYELDADSL
jgi:ParB-like chromosome segregation protein Spo0J